MLDQILLLLNCWIFQEFENLKNFMKIVTWFRLCSKKISTSLSWMDTGTKDSAPWGHTGCVFSGFLFHIHHSTLQRTLRTAAASNSQEKAITPPQVIVSQFSQRLPETRNLTKKQLVGATPQQQGDRHKQKQTAGWSCDLHSCRTSVPENSVLLCSSLVLAIR